MADEIDMAQESYERILTSALAQRLNQRPVGESLTHCTDCEDEIPEARRIAALGCTRCTYCQNLFEHRRAV